MTHLLGEKSLDCLVFISLNDDARQETVRVSIGDEVTEVEAFRFGDWMERWQALCDKWSQNAVVAKLEELSDRGYIDYGVSAPHGWLTDDGIAKLREFLAAHEAA